MILSAAEVGRRGGEEQCSASCKEKWMTRRRQTHEESSSTASSARHQTGPEENISVWKHDCGMRKPCLQTDPGQFPAGNLTDRINNRPTPRAATFMPLSLLEPPVRCQGASKKPCPFKTFDSQESERSRGDGLSHVVTSEKM